jgi:hypothetical protein
MAEMVMRELDSRFPHSDILCAFGILYPQYWVQEGVEEAFPKHLDVLKAHFCESTVQQARGEDELPQVRIPGILSAQALDIQQSLFKVTMKAQASTCMKPPFERNPYSRLWDNIGSSQILSKMIPEYLKLAEIGCVFVLGSVEDERTFSSLKFLKSRLRNRLGENLPLAVRMHAQRFYTQDSFPYGAALESWKKERMRYAAYD